jgi:FkbH-like protein
VSKRQYIKCVVWDLDGTIWDGVLVENGGTELRGSVADVIQTLDRRGILHSIASRNSSEAAMARLEAFGLAEYFLYPQIHWGSKAESIREISRRLNIGVDSIAFVDDQAFERDAVRFALAEVLCIDASRIESLVSMPAMNPRFITDDSRKRRQMYLTGIVRNQAEAEFAGAPEAFLASLNMVVTIFPAGEDDLRRAEELTERTHQLNTTGHAYSWEDLDGFRDSSDHRLLLASLDDKYGTYGTVGLALVECSEEAWTITSFFLSCRVLSRGIASVMLRHLRNEASRRKVRLLAEFIPNDANLMTSVLYKFAGFREIARQGGPMLFEDPLPAVEPFPEHLQVIIRE